MPQRKSPRAHKKLGTADTVMHGRRSTTRTEELTARMFRLAPDMMVDHFQVIRSLGRGGTGEVYLARDTKLGRKVALKVIHLEGSEEATSHFLHEAQATAQFNHPHIVTIHASGEIDGHPYVALEYLEGGDLRTRLQDGPLPLPEALRTALAVAEALAEAHRFGILHRDLKPENVVIPNDGRVRVVDFGLAQLAHGLGEDIPDTSLTPIYQLKPSALTSLAGTPEYMSPEQWLLVEATTAVDVWAFGILLFEMLCGRVPFALTSSVKLDELARAICSRTVSPSVQTFVMVPPAVETLIAECLEKLPGDRPGTDDLVERLTKMVRETGKPTLEQQTVFRGLLPYEERNANEFFGRDSEVAAFLERVRVKPVLPVIGPAGAGKTSFVLAGVLPRLRERGYNTVLMVRPGDDPFRALASRLTHDEDTGRFMAHSPGERPRAAPGVVDSIAARLKSDLRALGFMLRDLASRHDTRVVLFIDQVEELFELTDDPELQRAFLTAVCLAADDFGDPVRVIFAVREHYLGHMASSDVTRQALSSVTVLRAPDPDRMTDILRRSAEMVGYAFEDDDLLRDMVAEVAGEPTGLPLLSFAARQLFERRDRQRRLLLRQAYQQMGGVAGALATHADGVIDGFTPDQLRLARQMLLRLVTRDGTRKVTSRDDALLGLAQPEADEVLNRLVDARLVALRKSRSGELRTTLELTQESLIGAWDTLARWVHESREEIAFLSEVTQAAQLWDQRGRRDAELWQGNALRDAVTNHGRASAETPDLVRLFLARGLTLERRRMWRRRGIMTAAVVAAIVAVVVLLWQKREADFQRDRAIAQQHKTEQQRAEALRQAARAALRSGRVLEARAVLRASLEVEDSTLARALWWELGRAPLLWSERFDTIAYDVQFAPDGKSLAVACQSGLVYAIDTETKATTPLRGHEDQVITVTHSADGQFMMSGSWAGEVIVRNTKDSSIVRRWNAHKSAIWSIVLSRDGKRLLTAGADQRARLWSFEEGSLLQDFAHDSPVRGAVWSGDESHVITGAADGKLRRWNVSRGEVAATEDAHEGGISRLARSTDGRRLVTGGQDLTAGIWSAETLRRQHVLTGHGGTVQAASFSPDGKLVATAGRGPEVSIWKTDTGELVRSHAVSRAVLSVAFSPDGKRLAVTSMDELQLLNASWDAAPRQRAHRDGAFSVAFSPDGKRIATGSYDRDVLIWKVNTGEVANVLSGHTDTVSGVRYTPDGRFIVSASNDRTVRIWNAHTGALTAVLGGAAAPLQGLDVSKDGRLVVASGSDGSLIVWDRRDGTLLQRITSPDSAGRVSGAQFLPDSSWIVAPGPEGVVLAWDWKSGRPTRRLRHGPGLIYGLTRVGGGLVGLGDGKLWWWRDMRSVREVSLQDGVRHYDAAALPGRDHIVLVDSSGDVHIRSLSDDTELVRRSDHDAEVNRVAVDPSGDRIATASDDGTLRLWSTKLEPVWQTSGLLTDPVRLHSHRGWQVVEGNAPHEITPMDRAVEKASRAVPSNGGACLLTSDGGIEVWRKDDAEPAARTAAKASQVVGADEGCAFVVGDAVSLLGANGETTKIDVGAPVGAITVDGTGDSLKLLVASGQEVRRYERSGRLIDSVEVGSDVTAIAVVNDVIVVGHRDGNLQGIAAGDGAKARRLERTPAARVVRMIAGPRSSVVAGYANGVVAMWDVGTGTKMGEGKLHGPVRDLVLQDQRLFVASALGQHDTWDLRPFYDPYCDVLGDVWEHVSVRWDDGHAVRGERPADHACAK
jgi:WD40 repeat protein/serine/threonine protein kinase